MKKVFQNQNLKICAITALFSALLIVACKKDEWLKDVKVYVSSDVLLNPLSISFRDGNIANSAISTPISLEITGVDADKIYSVVGKQKDLTPDGDIFHVAMKKKFEPSPSNPIMFTVTAKADGYMDAVKTFVLTSSDYKIETMSMIKKSEPPKGVTVKIASSNTGNVLTSDFYIETEAVNDNTEKLGFRIKAGTQFYGGTDGKTPLNGNMTVSVAYMSGENLETDEFFPGGNDGVGQVYELNGKPKKPSTAAVASCAVIDVYVGGIKATNFINPANTPLVTTMTISEDIENPNNNFAKVKEGDGLSIWSMSEQKPYWQEEEFKTLTKNADGKFEVSFKHNHLSSWFAGWMIPVDCTIKSYKNPINGQVTLPDANPEFEIASDLNSNSVCGTGGTGFFYTEIIGSKRGDILASGYYEYYNGRKIKLSSIFGNGVSELSGILKIYSGSESNKKDVLYSQNVVFCNSTKLNIGSALPKYLAIGVQVDAECANLAVVLPSAPVLFRESGEAQYRLLGYVNNGTGCAGNLQKGKKYDFKVAFGGIDKEAKGLVVPAQDSTVTIDYKGLSDTIKWEYQGDNKDKIILKYQNIKIPEALCKEYEKYLKGG